MTAQLKVRAGRLKDSGLEIEVRIARTSGRAAASVVGCEGSLVIVSKISSEGMERVKGIEPSS